MNVMSLSKCAADIRFCPLLCRLEKTTFYVFFCAPFHNQKYYYLFYEIFRIRFGGSGDFGVLQCELCKRVGLGEGDASDGT